MWIIGLNLLVGIAMFAIVLGITYLASLYSLRVGSLPPLPDGGSLEERCRGRAREIVGVQAVYAVFAAIAAFLLTGVAFLLLFIPPVGLVFVLLIGFPIEAAVKAGWLPDWVAFVLVFAIPAVPIHVVAQYFAYGFAVREVKSLAASASWKTATRPRLSTRNEPPPLD